VTKTVGKVPHASAGANRPYRSYLLHCALALAATMAALLAGCGDATGGECLLASAGPADELLYVGNVDSRDVTVVDPRTCEAVATLDVGVATTEGNASSDGRRIFMSSSTGHVVVVLDTETNEVARIIDDVEQRPVHTFFSPDHANMWVGNDHSASVSVVDVSTLQVEHTIPTGEGHHKMALTDGDPYWVYVSNIVDSTISAINSATMTVEATIDVSSRPHGMDYASAGKKVYNCGGSDPAGIDVIATEGAEANTVTDFIELPGRCGYLHIEPGGARGWAVMKGEDAVAVFDTATDELTAVVDVHEGPDKLGFFADDLVLVSHVASEEVAFIDMHTLTMVESVRAGAAYVDPESGRGHRFIMGSVDKHFAYVPNGYDDTVSIIDVRERALRGTVAVGRHPMPIAVGGPGGGVAYPR
jgi:YVTN family beta-propeller protein